MNNHFDKVKWLNLTFYEQMGNIGSEVGRTMNAIKRNDPLALEGAYFRGLDLIDATADNITSLARRRELLRARELFSKSVESKIIDQKLDDYFMVFAVLARS